jgi:hypothetical protein
VATWRQATVDDTGRYRKGQGTIMSSTDPTPVLLGLSVLAFASGLLFGLIRFMVRQARRWVMVTAQKLDLSPAADGIGFTGTVGGIPVRLAANAVYDHATTPTGKPDCRHSATGEALVVASLPHRLTTWFYVQSVPVGGRQHLPGRWLSSDEALDRCCSIITTDEAACRDLLLAPTVHQAILNLAGLQIGLFEIGPEAVSFHGGHYKKADIMVEATVALARSLAEQAERLSMGRS